MGNETRVGRFVLLTRIRSINKDDLNIQSRRTSSLRSRSSKLPLEQCSVTTPKIPESKNSPRNRLMFSCLMSLSWVEESAKINAVNFQVYFLDVTSFCGQLGHYFVTIGSFPFISNWDNHFFFLSTGFTTLNSEVLSHHSIVTDPGQ